MSARGDLEDIARSWLTEWLCADHKSSCVTRRAGFPDGNCDECGRRVAPSVVVLTSLTKLLVEVSSGKKP